MFDLLYSKYVTYALCGFITSSIGWFVLKKTEHTIKQFFQTVSMSVVFALIGGVISYKYLDKDDMETASIVASLVSLFTFDLIREFQQVIDDLSDIIKDFLKRKTGSQNSSNDASQNNASQDENAQQEEIVEQAQ